MAAIERFFIAIAAGLLGFLLGEFCGFMLWSVALGLPGSGEREISKFAFLHLPAGIAFVAWLIALFSPDRAADFMGGITSRVYKLVKEAFESGAP
jgi:hypothetical protein